MTLDMPRTSENPKVSERGRNIGNSSPKAVEPLKGSLHIDWNVNRHSIVGLLYSARLGQALLTVILLR